MKRRRTAAEGQQTLPFGEFDVDVVPKSTPPRYERVLFVVWGDNQESSVVNSVAAYAVGRVPHCNIGVAKFRDAESIIQLERIDSKLRIVLLVDNEHFDQNLLEEVRRLKLQQPLDVIIFFSAPLLDGKLNVGVINATRRIASQCLTHDKRGHGQAFQTVLRKLKDYLNAQGLIRVR